MYTWGIYFRSHTRYMPSANDSCTINRSKSKLFIKNNFAGIINMALIWIHGTVSESKDKSGTKALKLFAFFVQKLLTDSLASHGVVINLISPLLREYWFHRELPSFTIPAFIDMITTEADTKSALSGPRSMYVRIKRYVIPSSCPSNVFIKWYFLLINPIITQKARIVLGIALTPLEIRIDIQYSKNKHTSECHNIFLYLPRLTAISNLFIDEFADTSVNTAGAMTRIRKLNCFARLIKF